MAGKNNKRKVLKFPVTARQAQKLLNNPNQMVVDQFSDEIRIVEFIKHSLCLESTNFDYVQSELNKIGYKNPNHVIAEDSDYFDEEDFEEEDDLEADNLESEYSPKGTDEVNHQSENPSDESDTHGGDNASQEVENSLSQGGDEQCSNSDNAQLQSSGTNEGRNGNGSGLGLQADRTQADGNTEFDCSGLETGTSTSKGSNVSGSQRTPSINSAEKSNTDAVLELGENTALSPMSEINRNNKAIENFSSRDERKEAETQNYSDSSESLNQDNFKDLEQTEDFGDIANNNEATQGQSEDSEDSQNSSDSDKEFDCSDFVTNSDEKVSDEPQHQKKWGKFGSKKGQNSSDPYGDEKGELVLSLKSVGVDGKLRQLAISRLQRLVYESNDNYSFRRDYQEFCNRLKTYRNVYPARKEESGKPSILVMADLSGSCSHFSEPTSKLTKVLGSLGVPGCDIVTIGTYDGKPCEIEVNGKQQELYKKNDYPISNKSRNRNHDGSGFPQWEKFLGHDFCGFPVKKELDFFQKVYFPRIINQYNIKVIICIGDWQGTWAYVLLALNPDIEKVIWLDNKNCSHNGKSEGRDRTNWALNKLKGYGIRTHLFKNKLIYKDGCKDAISFVKSI